MKIALSPAHTPAAQGATYNGISEYGLSCAVIGDLIYRLTRHSHEPHLIGSGSNSQQVEQINKINPDIGLELHFNASISAKMNGTETLHSGSGKGGRLAFGINILLVEMLRTWNRGTKIGYYQQDKTKPIIEIIRNTRCPFVVVEPLFLSNPGDFAKIDIQLISIAIFEGILRYREG